MDIHFKSYEWLTNPLYWQEKTLKIENDLSDNLHLGLTNKFMNSSSKFFINSTESQNINNVEINQDNDVLLDGKKYGFAKGFDLVFNDNVISHSLFSISHVKNNKKYD